MLDEDVSTHDAVARRGPVVGRVTKVTPAQTAGAFGGMLLLVTNDCPLCVIFNPLYHLDSRIILVTERHRSRTARQERDGPLDLKTESDQMAKKGIHVRVAAIAKSKVSLAVIMSAIEDGGYVGFCTACGAEHEGCEPDAREYPCESCGEKKVYGAEELLIMHVA